MTKNPKIIVDTNVIVAASILVNIRELDIDVKHHFYNQSRRLFSIFKKRPKEQIGISVPTMRSEAFLVLSKAVRNSFIMNKYTDIKTKETFYNDAVALTSLCEHKMRYLFSLLLNKTPNESNTRKNFQRVKEMSFYLKELWHTQYRGRNKKETQSKQRARSITTEPRWNDEQKTEVVKTYRLQVTIEGKQLERFMKKFPNLGDEWILAETITVKEDYEKIDENYQYYIASCDMGFFSPLIYHYTKSDLVTNEINERFEIVCDLPDVIFWFVDEPLPEKESDDEV